MVEVQTQVRVASGVEAIVLKAADRAEPLDSECNKAYYCITMKNFQDFMSKLDSTEKHESNFGNSFQTERFSFLLKSSMDGGVDPRNSPPPAVRTPLSLWYAETEKL